MGSQTDVTSSLTSTITSVSISNSEASPTSSTLAQTSLFGNSAVIATSVTPSSPNPSSLLTPSTTSTSHTHSVGTNTLHGNIVKFGGALGGSFGALILLILLYFILRAHGYVSAFKRKARSTSECARHHIPSCVQCHASQSAVDDIESGSVDEKAQEISH